MSHRADGLNDIFEHDVTVRGKVRGKCDTPVEDPQLVNKKYVDDEINSIDFWERVGTTLSPKTSGDSLQIDGEISIGAAPESSRGLNIVKTSPDNSETFYGLYNTVTADTTPANPMSKGITGIFGYPIIQGTNFLAGATGAGLDFNGGFLVGGAGDTTNLNLTGINIYGCQSFFGQGQANLVTGVTIKPTGLVLSSSTKLGTGAIGLNIADSDTIDNTFSPYQKQLLISKPTKATTNYQVVLKGNGDGSGIWFDENERIWSDGSKLCFGADGDTTNYTSIANDGEINLHGTARVIKCVQIGAEGIKAPGAKPATEIAHGTLETPAFQFSDEGVEANQQTVSFTIKIPCDMDRSVAPNLAFGWSSASTGNAKYSIEYLWRADDEDTTASAQATLTGTDSASSTADGLVSTTSDALAVPSSTDVFLQCRLKRLSADAQDTISDTIELHGVALVYTANKLGEAT